MGAAHGSEREEMGCLWSVAGARHDLAGATGSAVTFLRVEPAII